MYRLYYLVSNIYKNWLNLRGISILPSMAEYPPHLAAGSQQPPKIDGKLRHYSMEFCPYAQRTRLVLNAKKIPHDNVNINLGKKPEWYFEIHPEGKVPSIDTGSEVIVESLIIADFLDEKYPNPPLYPKDPEVKKQDKELIEQIDSLTKLYYKSLVEKDSKTLQEWADEYSLVWRVFEKTLAARGTTFFGGDKPGMVDYMLWPWGERAGVLKLSFGQPLPYKETEKSAIKKWHQAMLEDPIVKSTYHAPEIHWKFTQFILKKQPADYDHIYEADACRIRSKQ